MTGKRPRKWVLPAFLAAECVLYAIFLAYDYFNCFFVLQIDTVPFKYAGIVLCFLMALYSACSGGDTLLPWALGFTLGADLFLLVLGRDYLYGLLFFCLVQGVYALRLWRAAPEGLRPTLRLGLAAVLLLGLFLLGQLSVLTAVGAVYLSCFVCNLLHSLSCSKLWGRLFSVGLGLYFLCDICVGIVNMGAPPLVNKAMALFALLGMWLFYLPGKVLIVLSGCPEFLRKGDCK